MVLSESQSSERAESEERADAEGAREQPDRLRLRLQTNK